MLTESLLKELSLLERHLDVLRCVQREGPIGIRRLADEAGLTESKARYSLRVLEKEGYVEPSQRGATAEDADLEEVREGLESVEARISTLIERLGKN